MAALGFSLCFPPVAWWGMTKTDCGNLVDNLYMLLALLAVAAVFYSVFHVNYVQKFTVLFIVISFAAVQFFLSNMLMDFLPFRRADLVYDDATLAAFTIVTAVLFPPMLLFMKRTVKDYLSHLTDSRLQPEFVFLLVVFVLFYLYHLGKVNLRRERVVNTLWNMKPEETPTTSFFISRFKEVIEARLENSALSVEDLAADMNLSRVQLYRKVKSITGSTPVELLRTARLNRAYQLLLTSDRSVSEVAYLVGFTAPSYFTKCFKEEYGMLPGEVRNQ
jgi:AraC-like DNA-binding protein